MKLKGHHREWWLWMWMKSLWLSHCPHNSGSSALGGPRTPIHKPRCLHHRCLCISSSHYCTQTGLWSRSRPHCSGPRSGLYSRCILGQCLSISRSNLPQLRQEGHHSRRILDQCCPVHCNSTPIPRCTLRSCSQGACWGRTMELWYGRKPAHVPVWSWLCSRWWLYWW